MLTEHIDLPDPIRYRRITVKNIDGGRALKPGFSPFKVQACRTLSSVPAGTLASSKVIRRLDLCTCSSVEETRAVVKEMQTRMDVARKLLGLEV